MDILQNSMFDFAYRIAMRDAVLRGAFTGGRKDLHKIVNAKKAVLKLFIDILKGKFTSQLDYDNEFDNTAHTVCNEINKDQKNNNFKFGNAQKLINMTLKYMYLRCYNNLNERSKFQYCHCPMDRIMLEKVWDSSLNNSILTLKNEFKSRSNFIKSWSAEDFPNIDRYKSFQETVEVLAKNENADYNRLDYDYMMW